MLTTHLKWTVALLLVLQLAAYEACAAPADERVSARSTAAPAAVSTADGVPVTSSWTDELTTLQSEIPVLRARAEIAKLHADIANAQAATQSGPSAVQATPLTGTAAVVPAPEQQTSADIDVRLVSIAAWDGRYAAMLQIDGRSIRVREGDLIDGGWRVAHIGDTSVELDRRGRARRVGL